MIVLNAGIFILIAYTLLCAVQGPTMLLHLSLTSLCSYRRVKCTLIFQVAIPARTTSMLLNCAWDLRGFLPARLGELRGLGAGAARDWTLHLSFSAFVASWFGIQRDPSARDREGFIEDPRRRVMTGRRRRGRAPGRSALAFAGRLRLPAKVGSFGLIKVAPVQAPVLRRAHDAAGAPSSGGHRLQ